MKARLKTDGALAILMGVITILFWFFPAIYGNPSHATEYICFAIGTIMIIKGCLWRAFARGHKRKFPRWDLVTTGPYTLSRNPMYLGTFYAGCGFLLIAWPWWLAPIFAVVFYLRFVKEVKKEEAQLEECHKDNYRAYCKEVPRIFPSIKKVWKARLSEVIPLDELWATNEMRNIFIFPLLGFLLELLQESRVFGTVIYNDVTTIFLLTIFAWTTLFVIRYKIH